MNFLVFIPAATPVGFLRVRPGQAEAALLLRLTCRLFYSAEESMISLRSMLMTSLSRSSAVLGLVKYCAKLCRQGGYR